MGNLQKQHYTPIAYLNGFTFNREGKGQEFFLLKEVRFEKKGKVKEKLILKNSNPSKECYCKNIYTVQTDRLLNKYTDPNHVEKQGFPYEQSFIKGIQRIVTYRETRILFDEAKKIIETLLHIQLRNKYNKNLVNDSNLAKISAYRSLNTIKSQIKEPTLYDKIKKQVEEQLKRPECISDLYNKMLIQLPRKNSVSDQIVKHLLKFSFIVFCTDSKRPFLTSCNPGFFLLKDGGTRFTGAQNSIGFVFPLTATRLLTIFYKYIDHYSTPKSKFITYEKAKSDLVEMTNINTWHNSEESKVFSISKPYLEEFRKRQISK